jgi:hypothetical protein
MDEEHQHKFVFMRQDEVAVTGWEQRIGKWEFYDVFFCEGCLEYKRIKVLVMEPSRSDFGREVTWRKG